MSGGIVIAEFDKSTRARVRVTLAKYGGADLFDVRELAPFAGPANAFAPTRKGVSIAVQLLPQLREAVIEAERQAVAAGLLKPDK